MGGVILAASSCAGTVSRCGVFRSVNKGASWKEVSVGLSNYFFNSISVCGNRIFAGTNNGLLFSIDTGATWVDTRISRNVFHSVIICGSTIFAGSNGLFNLSNDIFCSNDSGATWKTININNASWGTVGTAFTVSGGYVFTGTINSGVWRRPFSEILETAQTQPKREMASLSDVAMITVCSARHNVAIECSVTKRDRVELAINDLTGRIVITLVDQYLTPGAYKYSWSFGRQTAGCYMVRMRIGSKSFSKMVQIVR
jgi:hypothetical protein